MLQIFEFNNLNVPGTTSILLIENMNISIFLINMSTSLFIIYD
jgi:hypothetical protein